MSLLNNAILYFVKHFQEKDKIIFEKLKKSTKDTCIAF